MSVVRKSIRDAMFIEQEGRCYYCGVDMRAGPKPGGKPHPNSATVDHVYPKAWGGDTHPDNLVLSCWTCNHTKANSLPTEPLPPWGLTPDGKSLMWVGYPTTAT